MHFIVMCTDSDIFFSRRSTFNADRITQLNRKHDDIKKSYLLNIYLFWSELNVKHVVQKIYPVHITRCVVIMYLQYMSFLKDLDQM